MEAVMAGWIAGYAMSVLSTFALTFLAVKAPDMSIMRRWFPDISPWLVAVPASIGTVVLWTMAGLLFAMVYELLDLGSSANFLGSPSLPFVIGMAALALMPLPFLLLVMSRFWWLWCGMSLAFVGLFGWFMPVLAER